MTYGVMSQRDDRILFVYGLDRYDVGDPISMHHVDFRLGRLFPATRERGGLVLEGDVAGLVAQALRVGPSTVEGILRVMFGVTGPYLAMAIQEKLAKFPASPSGLGHRALENLVLVGSKTADLPPSAEDGLFAGVSGVGDGSISGTAILRTQYQSLVQEILAAAHDNRSRFVFGGIAFLAYGIPRSAKRSKWAVRLFSVGRRKSSGPVVIAVRCHKQSKVSHGSCSGTQDVDLTRQSRSQNGTTACASKVLDARGIVHVKAD